jgi:molybdopterin molybdotransferase
MTGAPIPAGADAVVMVEDSERVGADGVRLTRSVPAGAAIRRAGDDVRVGDVLFGAGTAITPAVDAVLASVNVRSVTVSPRARVAVLSTGDELVDDGSPLQPGQIRESNKTMLAALLAEAGCEVVDLGVVRDDEADSNGCCATPPLTATRSSRAVACRWATTTWSRRCSGASPT